MDNLEALHRFGLELIGALNTAEVRPIKGKICAILVVVGNENDQETPPIGVSANFDDETESWEISDQAQESERA